MVSVISRYQQHHLVSICSTWNQICTIPNKNTALKPNNTNEYVREVE